MKILFATDGSKHSENAARFIKSFNLSKDDEIQVLHAVSWLPVMREWESLADDFQKIREEVVPRILKSTSDILKSTAASIHTSYREDFPDKAILEAAEEWSVDLIVMGAKGLRGIITHIVGSITKTVAAKAHIPVLIIKTTGEERTTPKKILFATDGSEHSDAMAGTLSSMPFPDDTEVTVLNVSFSTLYDIPDQYSMEVDGMIRNIVAHTREEDSRISEEITAKSVELLKDRFPGVTRETKFGDPPESILSKADEMGADIIALGRSGRRGILRKLGSVSRYVLNHAKCSVLLGN